MRMCEYCRAVVVREKLGVISRQGGDLVGTGSPLSGWTERAWRGAGSACWARPVGHAGDGLWVEWYTTFNDGRFPQDDP
jgi:hypothetical protein